MAFVQQEIYLEKKKQQDYLDQAVSKQRSQIAKKPQNSPSPEQELKIRVPNQVSKQSYSSNLSTPRFTGKIKTPKSQTFHFRNFSDAVEEQQKPKPVTFDKKPESVKEQTDQFDYKEFIGYEDYIEPVNYQTSLALSQQVIKKILLQTEERKYDMEYKIYKKDITANRLQLQKEKKMALHKKHQELINSVKKVQQKARKEQEKVSKGGKWNSGCTPTEKG